MRGFLQDAAKTDKAILCHDWGRHGGNHDIELFIGQGACNVCDSLWKPLTAELAEWLRLERAGASVAVTRFDQG